MLLKCLGCGLIQLARDMGHRVHGNELGCLVGYCAVQSRINSPMFQRFLLPPFP